MITGKFYLSTGAAQIDSGYRIEFDGDHCRVIIGGNNVPAWRINVGVFRFDYATDFYILRIENSTVSVSWCGSDQY